VDAATNGTISAPVIVRAVQARRDFEVWRGKLAGKIAAPSRCPTTAANPAIRRSSG